VSSEAQRSLRSWLLVGLVVAVAVAGLTTVALLGTRYRAYEVPSGSMEPMLRIGDHVLVKRTHAVHDGDVVIFQSAEWGVTRRTSYVKRVIATGGQRVHETVSQVAVDGHVLDEPYAVADREGVANDTYDLLVPRGRMWVLGDNRPNSADSRFHVVDGHQGTVAVSDVVGVVVRHGSRLETYGLPVEQGAAVGVLAGAVTVGAAVARRRTLEA
jgi:signal peptidase I